MIHLFHHWLENRRLKRELAAWWAERERNIAARKQSRMNGMIPVNAYERRRG